LKQFIFAFIIQYVFSCVENLKVSCRGVRLQHCVGNHYKHEEY